jgi:hypothetical protein
MLSTFVAEEANCALASCRIFKNLCRNVEGDFRLAEFV